MSVEDNKTPQPYAGTAMSLAGAVEPFQSAIAQDQYPSEDNETPQHYMGPTTSVSSLAGAVEPLQRAIVQNQCSDCPSDDNETPQHYEGAATSVSSLAGAVDPTQPAIAQNQYSNCPSQRCLYWRDGNECGESITCGTAPEHFRTVHNIKHMSREDEVVCQWPNCKYDGQKHNFMRHVRQIHMGHMREKGHQN
ncbi:hypothetical protein F5141DRAFT_1152051 [Pisolithus sp. B1]|nr:hypothetical protein F5141DRAFT_1152051 [Pisolithus sp. B1]